MLRFFGVRRSQVEVPEGTRPPRDRPSSARSSSPSATSGCGRWRMTPPTGWSAATRSSTPRPDHGPPCRQRHAGRIFNVLGEPIDEIDIPVEADDRWPIHRFRPRGRGPDPDPGDPRDRDQGSCHLLAPYPRGGKVGLFGGAGLVGKTCADPGADPNDRRGARGHLGFLRGRASASREGNDPPGLEMKESGTLEKTMLVFGQMNEPPGARLRVALSG